MREHYDNRTGSSQKKIDTSGTLVLDYGKFKATCIACKDCKAPLNTCVQGDAGYIKSDEASSVINTIKYVKNDGTKKEFKLNKHPEISHYSEYLEFKRIFLEKDLKTAQYWNKETLKVAKVMDKALASANIKFK